MSVALLGTACSDQLPTEVLPTTIDAPRLNLSANEGTRIGTDKQDYYLGETVQIEGFEWAPGETVRLQVVHVDELGDNTRPEHQPWEVTVGEDGYFTASWEIALDGDEDGATLKLTADGGTSEAHAEVIFTDLAGTVNLFADAGRTISQNAFEWNSTVYPSIRTPSASTCYRLTWTAPDAVVSKTYVQTTAPPGTNANPGTQAVAQKSGTWSVVADQRAASGACDITNDVGFVSATNTIFFDVARRVVIGAGTSSQTDSPGGDQCVKEGSNLGTDCENAASVLMAVRFQTSNELRSLVRFDMPSSPAIPAGVNVTSAKVRLSVAGTASGRTYRIQRADASWSEGTVVWTGPGGTGTTDDVAMASALVPGVGGGDPQTWVKWTVTADVQGFVNSSFTNNGWRISDVTGTSSATGGRFHTTENTDGCAAGVTTCKRKWPVLLIDYTTSVPDNTSIVTAIHDGNPATDVAASGVTSVALGSTVHDKATVSNSGGGSGNGTPEGTVAFTFWTDGSCGADAGTSSSAGASAAVNASGIAHPSDSRGPLAAGSYSFKATFTSSDAAKWNNSTSDCEPLTVNKATPTLTTAIHRTDHSVIADGSYIYEGTQVHDSGALSDLVSGFGATGTITYSFYRNGACTGTAAATSSPLALPGGAESGAFPSTGQPLPPGQYSYKASYSGNANYNDDTSDCEPFTVVPHALVTGGGFCTFDRRSDVTGQQFNAIFTPEAGATTSKLNATNPGQFRYSVFYIPSNGTGTVDITIPAGFVTQGATPVHVYGAAAPVTTDGVTCFTPSSERKALQLTTTDGGGGTLTVDITGLGSPAPGVILITVHLDYYWKGVASACTKQPTGTNPVLEHADCATPIGTQIQSLTDYTFGAFGGNSDFNETIENFNVFKKDPGIGGLVLRAGSGDPVENVLVEIYQGTKKLGTARTDEDGWYMWVYKYTGKATTFTVTLPAYSLTQTVTLKSNGYGIINFTIP